MDKEFEPKTSEKIQEIKLTGNGDNDPSIAKQVWESYLRISKFKLFPNIHSLVGKKFICKVTVKKISLKIKPVKRTLYLKGNKSIRLKTIVTGPYRKVRYKSSNKNIVKVNGKGKVTAVRKGKAKITVTANGIKKKCRITVLSVKRKKHKG